MNDQTAEIDHEGTAEGGNGNGADADASGGLSAPQGAASAMTMPPLSEQTEDGANGAEERNLEVILDVPVTLSMEIGRARVPIRSLLQLNQGSVVELERLAGEPLDVLVNGTLIAHGEVVVVNERYGIRFTDIVSPAERVQKLR